jgi:hypothetical protein
MASMLVIFAPPHRRHFMGPIERSKPTCVKQFLPNSVVERFDKNAICRLSWRREVEFDLVPRGRLIERLGDGFGQSLRVSSPYKSCSHAVAIVLRAVWLTRFTSTLLGLDQRSDN